MAHARVPVVRGSKRWRHAILVAPLMLGGCFDPGDEGDSSVGEDETHSETETETDGDDCDADCNGVCGGSAVEDMCGVCDDDPTNDCRIDCAGTWGGTAMPDLCGVCDGNNADRDCGGICFGSATLDMCGTCDNNPDNDCTIDCRGEWGGEGGSWLITPSMGAPPSIPANLKVACTSGPFSPEGDAACVVATCDGVTYWPLSHVDNSSNTTMVGYGPDTSVVKQVTRSGARYAWNITNSVVAHTLTVHGQDSATVSFSWSELAP